MATTYYVDFVNGLDANNGLGPDASHASNKPWKTITKLLGAAGMASGDTAYLAPGSFRETVAAAMTSAVAETKVIGDPQNAQGFKTSGAVAVAAGPVILTAYTTNDKTAPSATALLDLASRDFLTFQNIMFVGGNASCVAATTTTSTNITFTDCAFVLHAVGAVNGIACTVAFSVAVHWLIDRCLIFGLKPLNGNLVQITPATGVGADWDLDFVVRNTMIIGGNNGVVATGSGASANKGGGVVVRNCYILTGTRCVHASNTTISTTVPCVADNNVLMAGTGLVATTSGQITENYNIIYAATALTNVTAGANSISDGSYAPMFHFGQERIWGSPLYKPFMQPMQGSPWLAFGNDGSQTATDAVGLQRPAGGAGATPAAGPMERHNNWITDPSPIGTGVSPIKITGPGDQAFVVPVPAASTTISVVVKWDATYAGTKPQLQLAANGLNGVATQTVTAAGSSGSNETLTLAAFTPTKAGLMVTVRVKSNDTNGAGVVQADSFSVTV